MSVQKVYSDIVRFILNNSHEFVSIHTKISYLINVEKNKKALPYNQMKTTIETEWLTVEGLSQYVGLSKATIHQLCSQKKLPYYQPGKKLLFKRDEIRELIEASRVDSESTSTNPLTLKTTKDDNQ